MNRSEEDSKWHLIQARLQRLQAVEVMSRLEAEGIDSVILKGIAVHRYYPEGASRPSVDLDIAVPPEHFDRAARLMKAGELGNMLIDLHRGLRHFDLRPWNEVFEKTVLVDVEEGKIRVLCPEDQLRVVCVHWLTDGGERKERLWDVHHLVAGCDSDFDWGYCLDANGPVRRRWIICAIGLAAMYTGLDLSKLPFKDEASDLPDWLVQTLEKRWEDELPFSPLDNNLGNWRQFYGQLRRRFPPNAVMATIGTEGEFDSGPRLPYQLRYFAKRLVPSAWRTVRSFFRRLAH